MIMVQRRRNDGGINKTQHDACEKTDIKALVVYRKMHYLLKIKHIWFCCNDVMKEQLHNVTLI